jgi:thymidylate synthase (FAD)
MKVDYVDHMGTDLSVVNSARVSFNKTVDEMGKGDIGLINFLARHKHFTPFTHATITLREKVPIFIARQRFKHVVGFSYNEVSRRYVSGKPEFHIPENWRSRPESVKQGSSTTDFVENLSDDISVDRHYYTHIQQSEELYTEMVNSGVCPEQARMVLPQSMLTEYYVTGSLMAWARAHELRKGATAQIEIQQLSEQWDKIISPLFPVSWKALTKGDD